MAVFGSIDILTQLLGGQQVLNQLNQIKATGQQIGATPVNVNVNTGNLNSFNASLQNTSRTLNTLSGSWDRTLQGVARFSDGLTHAGQVAATFAYRLTLITAPIDLLIAKGTQFTIGLEYSLAKVGTQLDGTLAQIRRFAAESKAISLDLQAQYGVDARQQSEALYYLVSSGVSQQQAQQSLEPLSRLAAVTQTSPAIASQALVATLNVFGDELERFPNLADRTTYALEVMFDATRKGRFEFSDFATQFGRAAEQMHMANATFEETSAMLAALSQVFTPSQASTTLNSFAKAFLNPVEKAKDAFEELGVSMYEVIDGKNVQRRFADVFAETFDKIGSIAEKDQQVANELMGDLFGDLRGGRGAQFLADPRNRTLLQDILKEIGAGTDNIGQAWELMAEQIQTAINQTIGMFYKLGDAVVGNLEPAIRGALAGIQVFFKGLTDNPQVAQLIAQVGAGLAVAAPAALVFATALMGVGGLITAVATLMSPAYLIGLAALVRTLAPAFSSAATAVEGFGGGIEGILGVVTETAYQLGLINNKDRMKIFDQLGIQAKEVGRQAPAVKEFVSELRKLGDDAMRIGNGIKTIADGIAQLIDNIGKGRGVLGWLATTAGNIASAGSGLLGRVSDATGIGGSSGLAQVADVAIGGMLAAKIGSMVMGALSKLTVTTQNVAAGVVNLSGIPGGIAGALGGSALGIAGVASAAILALEYLGIRSVAERGGQERAATGKQSNFSDAFFQGLNSAAESYQKWHAEFNAKFYEVAGNIVNGLLQFLGELSASVYANPYSAAQEIFRVGITATITNVTRAVMHAVQQAVGAFIQFPDWVDKNVGGFFGFPYQGAGGFAGTPLLSPAGIGTAGSLVGRGTRSGASGDTILKRASDNAAFNLNRVGDAAKEAANKLGDAIKGLVSAALGATSVTEKDQERMDLEKERTQLQARLNNETLGRNQQRIVESRLGEITVRLEQLGAYKDQPDEFARRTRAVATGTDPAIYGQAYQEQLALAQSKMPGASLEDIAAAFGDKSLFAKMTPDEIDQMWNWDAVVDSVRRGIDRIVGEWKLMKQAVGEVMSQLTNDEIASLKEALGLGADTSLDSLASKFLGKTTGLGAEGQAIGGTIDEETMGTFGGFADILERIKDNADIVVKMSFDEKMWEKAKEAIDAAEEYIREHLAKYADIFIQITARFSEESGGGSGNTGGADGGKPPPEGKATGGYVTQGIYKVGEQGYEYVLPHPLTKWIETMMGGRINSPNDIMWLIQALTSPGGKAEALAKSADWAATQFGGYYEMPKNFANWINRIKVIIDDQKMSLDDALWQMGNPSVTTARSGGGGGAGGTGSGGSGDLSSLKASLDTLVAALNRLTRAIDAMSRAGFQTPQTVSDFVGGTGTRGGGGGSNSETIIFNGDIVAPNQATVKTLYDSIMNQTRRNTSARANHGMA